MSDQYDDGFYDGEQSKQSEINELRKRIDTAINKIESFKGFIDINSVYEILKGEEII